MNSTLNIYSSEMKHINAVIIIVKHLQTLFLLPKVNLANTSFEFRIFTYSGVFSVWVLYFYLRKESEYSSHQWFYGYILKYLLTT